MKEKEKEIEDLVNCQQERQENKKQRQIEIKGIQDNIVASKIADARSVKQQSYQNDIRKQMINNEFISKNQQRKSKVKYGEDMVMKKMNDFRQNKMEQFKNNYEERIKAEIDRMKKKEADMAVMEKSEEDLIKKLQNSQQTQKKVFKELQTALKYQSVGEEPKK